MRLRHMSQCRLGEGISELPVHDCLGDHAVDALRAVYSLSDAKIRGETAQRVSILARQVPLFAQQHDHVAQRPNHALVEVWIHRHGHVVRTRFRAGIIEPQILAQRQPETSLQGGLDCGHADLAVALHAMAVAARKQRAWNEYRKVERGAWY